MYKLLLDSDTLIKSSKAEFLHIIARNFDTFITGDVYDETVKEGKKRLYPDADKIEKLVKNGEIKILKYRKKRK